jgi:hypothetical protein
LVYQSFIRGEGVALSKFAEGNFAAPIVWLITGCCRRLLNLGVILIVYPKRNIPRSLAFTHLEFSPAFNQFGHTLLLLNQNVRLTAQ